MKFLRSKKIDKGFIAKSFAKIWKNLGGLDIMIILQKDTEPKFSI
jgi:hypothetical protein